MKLDMTQLTQLLRHELEQLPENLKSLTLKRSLELLELYEEQLKIINEMRNMAAHETRDRIMSKCIKKHKERQCFYCDLDGIDD